MKNTLIWTVGLLAVYALINNLVSTQNTETITYSQLVESVRSGEIQSVEFEGDGHSITGTFRNGEKFNSQRPIGLFDQELANDLYENNIEVIGIAPEGTNIFRQLMIASFPLLIMVGLIYLYMRNSQGGMGPRNIMGFGNNKAKMLEGGKVDTTLNDVAGCEEAKQEVTEIVDFLRDPKKFQNLGGRVPTGVLLIGQPGTGKTLLARAIAGEANVNFFTISGSDFVEMFVGVGASRVRNLFREAEKNAPCIIFIDEIDAVGRHRGAGLGGGHDEREQTLNQLLVEMDGFAQNPGIIIMAATNRPDVLDPALMRPGRFDRQVTIDLPDIKGREQILQVHLRKIRANKDLDTTVIARGTPGFSGADLANLVNESALMAARKSHSTVMLADMEAARDKILMGTERRTLAMTEEEKKLIAYHESGHAIVGYVVGDHDPIYKVTIVPRGRALGLTVFLPERDKLNHTKKSILASISSLYGGRVAEEIVFGKDSITTGASNDIERATQLARSMVTQWGLSSLGPIQFKEAESNPFIGRSMTGKNSTISNKTAEAVDSEVSKIIDTCYANVVKILTEYRSHLEDMANALMEWETLDQDQIADIMSGAKPRIPKPEPSLAKPSLAKPSQSPESAES